MSVKFKKEELYKMDAVDVYKLVLEGKHIKIFPNGFWVQPEAKSNAIKCLKYLIEDILNMSDEDIKTKLNQQIFKENKLGGLMMVDFIMGSPYKIVELVYPNKFKPWELKQVPVGYWEDNDNKIEAIQWLVEKKLNLSEDELNEQLSKHLFIDNGLNGLLAQFNGSCFKAIDLAYPNKFKPWEFKMTMNGFWKDESNLIEAIKWLIEERLKLTDNELKELLSQHLFIKNGLCGLLNSKIIGGSPYKAINLAYPNKFKPWDFKLVPMSYWENVDNIKYAVKWLVEENLKLSDKELKKQFTSDLLRKHRLRGILDSSKINGSLYDIINLVYPNRLKPWELNQIPMGYWSNLNNIKYAVKWLIEEKLGYSEIEVKNNISSNDFIQNGMIGVLNNDYCKTLYEAIDLAYPNKFKKEDFRAYSYNCTKYRLNK